MRYTYSVTKENIRLIKFVLEEIINRSYDERACFFEALNTEIQEIYEEDEDNEYDSGMCDHSYVAKYYKDFLSQGWIKQSGNVKGFKLLDDERYIDRIDSGEIAVRLTKKGENKFLSLLPFNLVWKFHLVEMGLL